MKIYSLYNLLITIVIISIVVIGCASVDSDISSDTQNQGKQNIERSITQENNSSREASISGDTNGITITLSERYMYSGTDVHVSVESEDEIESVYYYPVFSDTSVEKPYYARYWDRDRSINILTPDKDKHTINFTIPADSLYAQSYDLPIAVKLAGQEKTRGVVARFDVLEEPKVLLDYDRHNWESEQTIRVTPKPDVIESVVYVDPQGNKQSLELQRSSQGAMFKLNTQLPPPDMNGALILTSTFGLTSTIDLSTYEDDEQRIYFCGKKTQKVNGKTSVIGYFIYSNSLDCNDPRVEFEIPAFEFEDEYFSSLVDDSGITKHEVHPGILHLHAISPDKRYYVFACSYEKPVIGDKHFEGRTIKNISISFSIVYDNQTKNYKHFNSGYYYTMNPRQKEGSLNWDDFKRTRPLYWKSDTELIMLKTIPEDRFWSQYEAENDPRIKHRWSLSPPDPETVIICFNVEDLSTEVLEDHYAVRPRVQVTDHVTGITSWYGPYDDFRSEIGYVGWNNVYSYAISDKTGKHIWTAEDLCEKLGISIENALKSNVVGYLGATIYQNKPRAIIKTSNSACEYIYYLFHPITGDVEIIRKEKPHFDDRDPEYLTGEVKALRSCSANPETPPLIIIENHLYKLGEDGSITLYSGNSILPEDVNECRSGYFIR